LIPAGCEKPFSEQVSSVSKREQLEAAWEREVGRESQIEDIRRAKIEGKYKGRQSTARANTGEVAALHQQGNGAAAIAKHLGISRASVYPILAVEPGQHE
jgi:DNA invertase Pin-like site-specific DNA recombinase